MTAMSSISPHSLPPPTPDTLSQIFEQLTNPTNSNIRTAEARLLTYLSDCSIVNPLSQVLSHPSAKIRHFCAIVLRNALKRHTDAFTDSRQLQGLKSSILSLLGSELDPAARRGLIALASLICKQGKVVWPELMAIAIHLARSDNVVMRASAYSIFQALCDSNPNETLAHLEDLCKLIATGISDSAHPVRLSASRAYSTCVSASVVQPNISLTPLLDLLPSIGAMLTRCHQDRTNNGDFKETDDFSHLASSVFDICATMLEILPITGQGSKLKSLPDCFSQFYQLALTIFGDAATCRQARSAATEFIVFAIAIRPTSLRTEGLALTTIHSSCNVVFQEAALAAAPPNSGDDDMDDGDHEPINLALRVIYALAKRPELSKTTFTQVMHVVSKVMNDGTDAENLSHLPKPYAAVYRTIGAISEGSAQSLTSHAREIISMLVRGAQQTEHGYPTQARALEALAYVCESLDTNELPDDVLTEVSNSALDSVLSALHQKDSFVCKQACAALEPVLAMFSHDSDGLKARFSDILHALSAVGCVDQIAEEAVMAIAVLAEHAPEAFAESAMYMDVIQWILRVMTSANTPAFNELTDNTKGVSDNQLVRSAATNAAAVLIAHCKDSSVIETLAARAIDGLNSDDSQLTQATFSFFAKMADVVGGSVVVVFGTRVLQAAIDAMERDTVSLGLGGNEGSEDEPSFDPRIFDGSKSIRALGNGNGSKLHDQSPDDEIDDDEDAPSTSKLEIHPAYLDEKMVAVSAVGAFATACGTDSYAERIASSPELALEIRSLFSCCLESVEGLIRYYQDDVRSSAYFCLCRLAVANNELVRRGKELAFSDRDLIREMFPLLETAVQEEDEIEVMTNIISWYASFFRQVSPNVLADLKDSVVKVIESLLKREALCQVQVETYVGNCGLGNATNRADITTTAEAGVRDENGLKDDDIKYGSDEDAGDAEGDLMEAVGEMIVSISWSLRGYFASDFAKLLTQLLEGIGVSQVGGNGKTLGSLATSRSSDACPDRQKGTVFGTIAAVLLHMNWDRCHSHVLGVPSVGTPEFELPLRVADEAGAILLPIAAQAVRAESKTLRQNAMFLIGLVFAYSRESNALTWGLLPQTVKGLMDLIECKMMNSSTSIHQDEPQKANSVHLNFASVNHGALVDNAAGALSRILCHAKAGVLAENEQVRLLHAVLACVPIRSDPMENTPIAKALVKANFDSLVMSVDLARRAVQCLVTALVAYAEFRNKQDLHSSKAWVMDADTDLCDEITWIGPQDVWSMLSLLKRLSDAIGQVELSKLQLKEKDQKTVANMIETMPSVEQG